MTSPEDKRRISDIQIRASQDSLRPDEFIQIEIRGAIQRGNPLIDPSKSFVVLGFDGFDGNIFPTGSFDTPEEALEYADKKRGEEHLYSSDPESDIATRFQTYTMDGILVRPPEKTS